ncbi:hypothetical protein L0F63_001194 [Massospora cicadina]|nr:hypothetical protein L0F63_001194 [Massospora cicadina]
MSQPNPDRRAKIYERLNAQLVKLNINMVRLDEEVAKAASQAKAAQALSCIFTGMFMATQQISGDNESGELSFDRN